MKTPTSQSMTNDEIRIAIAEACGWKLTLADNTTHWTDRWTDPNGGSYESGAYFLPPDPPNYPGDLNACAEFEKTLTAEEAHLYSRELEKMFNAQPWHEDDGAKNYGWHASALHRCEAFLRTNGLWKD